MILCLREYRIKFVLQETARPILFACPMCVEPGLFWIQPLPRIHRVGRAGWEMVPLLPINFPWPSINLTYRVSYGRENYQTKENSVLSKSRHGELFAGKLYVLGYSVVWFWRGNRCNGRLEGLHLLVHCLLTLFKASCFLSLHRTCWFFCSMLTRIEVKSLIIIFSFSKL